MKDSNLLVEGNDDKHVVFAFCNKHCLADNFDVVDCGSVENVLKQAQVRINIPLNNRRIGLILDADINSQKRWLEIQNILKESNKYDVPTELSDNGLVLFPRDSYDSIIGVWIMPDNILNGMLEDFLRLLVPREDLVMNQVETTLTEIENEGINRYKSIHKAKARIHTYLAWQEDPGTPMGLAITKKYLDADSDIARLFVDWLKRLFS